MSSPGGSAAGNATLDDDVVTEILLRLPSSTVLRSRAVCRAWRRITTDRSFLAAHADRQPAELLVASRKRSLLDTIPLSLQVDDLTRCRSHLHYPVPEHRAVHSMLGSCDGLLLFDFDRPDPGLCSCDFFVCNPVTRQGIWLDLVPPTCRGNYVRMCGFYRHVPSGEHRLLVLANERGRTGPAAHYVFSLAEPPRRLGPVADGVVLEFYDSVNYDYFRHRGKLHWTMHPVAKSARKILSFDTVPEAFRLRSTPPWPSDRYHYPNDMCLLELDGMLAVKASEIQSDSVELWVLEDYENDQSWSRRFRIDLLPRSDTCWAMETGVPDVILFWSYMFSFATLYHLTEKRILKKMEFVNGTSGHFLFKESLVTYDFLDQY